MSYKIEIQNNFFVVTDTTTGIEEIREVRDAVKWRVSGSVYSFFYNIPNLVDQNTPNIIRLGENAKEFDFSEIVDSTETPFVSRAIFNTLLNVNLGKIIQLTEAKWGFITGNLNDQTDLVTILNGKFDVPTGDTTQYIAGDGTLITFPVAGQSGTLVREVRNTTGATLTKGTIVYINGAIGNKPTIAKALATSDATSAQTFGFLQSNISNNSNGFAVVVGDLTGLNTSAITEGTQLYLSSTTAGQYTTTKQVAPAHLVYVGIVTRSHPTQGQIEVKIQNGYELDELHDVKIQSPTNKNTIFYNSLNSLWENRLIGIADVTDLESSLSGKVSGSGTTNYVSKFTGATTIGNSLIYDNGTNVGIGTTSPSEKLDVNGNIRTTTGFISDNPTLSSLSLKISGTETGRLDNFNSALRLINFHASSETIIQGNGDVNISTVGSNVITLRTSNTERMRITAGGNVLIGTTTDAGYKLDVNGTGRFSGALSGTSATFSGSVSAPSFNANVSSFGTDVSVNSTIRVGSAFATQASIIFGDAGTPYWSVGRPAGSGNLTISSYALTALTIQPTTGNVGIGTTSPATKFQVSEIGSSFYVGNAFAKVENTAGASAILYLSDTTDSAAIKNIGSSLAFINSSSEGMRLTTSGLGIGTTDPDPSAVLDVASTTQGFLPPRMTDAEMNAISSPVAGLMVWNTDSSVLFVFDGGSWRKIAYA